MNTSQHAARILEAWAVLDLKLLDTELKRAQTSCRDHRHVSNLESEHRELLGSVIERLSQASRNRHSDSPSVATGLGLLRHLKNRPTGLSTR